MRTTFRYKSVLNPDFDHPKTGTDLQILIYIKLIKTIY